MNYVSTFAGRFDACKNFGAFGINSVNYVSFKRDRDNNEKNWINQCIISHVIEIGLYTIY